MERIGNELGAALRRKPVHETRLAGAVRTLAPFHPELAEPLAQAVDKLVKRGSFRRPLYMAAVRSLGEIGHPTASGILTRALESESSGGLATLSAAVAVRDPELGGALARVAGSRHPQLCFAAEVARVARGESDGGHLASVAPKIKESHRISLCEEIFVPQLWRASLPRAVAPALAVLRDAERHLGRWLVLAEIATRAGDPGPLAEAQERMAAGPTSSQAAWSLVAWALGGDTSSPPDVRPTVELVARLSDRPSADRDTTFLYRLAQSRTASVRTMLENLTRGSRLKEEGSIRAALYLLRDHGREDLREHLLSTAQSSRKEAVRGLAAAALHDAGEVDLALSLSEPLLRSRHLPTMTWGALLQRRERMNGRGLVEEPTYRRVQLGWVE